MTYDFKKQLSSNERLTLAFGDQAPSLTIIYRWYKEFERGANSVKDREGAGRRVTAVTEENIAVVKSVLE